MKNFLFVTLFIITASSCSSDDSTNFSNQQPYFTLNREGESFNQSNVLFVSLEVDNCNEPNIRLTWTSTGNFIETSEFNFAPSIIAPTLQEEIEFASDDLSSIVKDETVSSSNCFNTLDFLPSYWEENINVYLDNSKNNRNTIENISLISEDDTSALYAIKGKYDINYTRENNSDINLFGEYLIHVESLK